MATKPRKPSKYQSAYTQQLKELQKIVTKAQRKGIELSPSYTPPTPKRITQASIRKVERLSMKASVIVESTIRKQRTGAKEDLSRGRHGIAQEYIPHPRIRKGEKEREKLSPEEMARIRKQAAQKAAQTRREKEARLSAEEREELRQKRAEKFRESMTKANRKEAAKKAAQTRRIKESLLSPEAREALRQKRAEQFRKNIQKSKESWVKEADVIYKNVLKSIDNITAQYQNEEQSEFHYLNAQGLKLLLDDYIKEKGYYVVMELIHEQSHLFIKATEAILYASDQSIIDWGLADVISILSGKPMSIEYAKEIAELKEQLNSLEEVDSEEAWEDIKKFGW